MAQRDNKLRKAIVLIIALFFLVPCAFLMYDSVIASGEEKVEFYYMMNDGTMKPMEKKIRGENLEDTLLTTLHTLKEGPKTDGVSGSIPDTVEFLSVGLVNDTAIINVSDDYDRLKNTEEIICRSSIVWTLTSLDFVKAVEINVDGEPLLRSTGEEYGALNRNNVVIDAEISAETTEYAILSLYFANEAGTDLSVEERVVEVNANQAREKTILEQLIIGPEERGLHRTIPVETKIRDVTTTGDGTCYVDLSQDFVLKHSGGEIQERLTVYSIVNSLCELDHIKKVQFLVGGEKLDQFKGSLDFKTPFTAVSSLKTTEVQ